MGKCLEHTKWFSHEFALSADQFIGKLDRRYTHITMFMFNQRNALLLIRRRRYRKETYPVTGLALK